MSEDATARTTASTDVAADETGDADDGDAKSDEAGDGDVRTADGDTATASETEEVDAGGSGERTGGPALEVEDLRKSFAGLVAVDGATFSVERGSLTGLIGPNGAGKSTTFNCITGVHDVDGGRVRFLGEDITGLRTNRVAKRGLVRTFQIARELEEMTVLENLMLAPGGQRGESLTNAVLPGLRDDVRDQERAIREEVWETLELFEIDHLADEHAGNLSGGQRKLLELSRALMTDPDMLLLDEPFAGVNPTLEEKLLDRIHALQRERGLTFLLVEHDMDLIMNHCEHVIVMHQGQVLAEGPPEAIRDDEQVIDAYLGEEI